MATHDGRHATEYQHKYVILDPTQVQPVSNTGFRLANRTCRCCQGLIFKFQTTLPAPAMLETFQQVQPLQVVRFTVKEGAVDGDDLTDETDPLKVRVGFELFSIPTYTFVLIPCDLRQTSTRCMIATTFLTRCCTNLCLSATRWLEPIRVVGVSHDSKTPREAHMVTS